MFFRIVVTLFLFSIALSISAQDAYTSDIISTEVKRRVKSTESIPVYSPFPIERLKIVKRPFKLTLMH